MPSASAKGIVSALLDGDSDYVRKLAKDTLHKQALRSPDGRKRIHAWDITHAGIMFGDFASGMPTGEYDECYWGVGDNPRAAFDDALEAAAHDWDVSSLENELQNLPEEPSAWDSVIHNWHDYLTEPGIVSSIEDRFPEGDFDVPGYRDAVETELHDAEIGETPQYYLYLRLSNDPNLAS